MTVPEWEKRTFIDNHVVIRVHDHKTSASCGPIACILTLLTDRLLEAYVTKIRVHNQGAFTDKHVFLCDSGSPVQSGQVHKLLYSCVKRTNAIPRITKLSPTDIRKMWVTWDRDRATSTTENSELLAVYMQHNKQTADRWYDRRSNLTISDPQGTVLHLGCPLLHDVFQASTERYTILYLDALHRDDILIHKRYPSINFITTPTELLRGNEQVRLVSLPHCMPIKVLSNRDTLMHTGG
jgi:hypothetical protein